MLLKYTATFQITGLCKARKPINRQWTCKAAGDSTGPENFLGKLNVKKLWGEQSGTGFGDRVFKEVFKLKWGHMDGPYLYDWCPYEKRKFRHRHPGMEV